MGLKNRVRQTINRALKDRVYIGDFDVTKVEDTYVLKLYLNQPDKPLYFNYQGTEHDFLEYLYKDISQRQIDRTIYCVARSVDPGNDFYHVTINE